MTTYLLPWALSMAGLLTGAPAAAPRGIPEQVIPAPFGVNIHFVKPDEREADNLAAGGFQLIRMDFHWAGIEKVKGEYDFSGYDALVEGMSRRGIRCLFILDYGNPLYDGGASPCSDEGRAAFARWAAAAAKRYAGKGILWEIWNEPNISFWKPKPNVEDYVKLCQAIIPAVRQADPEAFIIGPASSTFPWDFLKVMGDRGVIAQLDAVSVHPYRQSNPETSEADYHRLRALIDHYSPDRHIPIVSGEWGYSTAWNGMSDEKQGQYIVRQWLTNMANDVAPSIWYDWHDDGSDPKEPEHHFGSVYRDFKPKPSYLAAQALCNTLRGYRFVRRVALNDAKDYLLLFRKGKAVAAAAWTSVEAHSVRLPLPAGPARLVAPAGGERAVTVGAEPFELALSGSPQYLLLADSDAARRLACWGPAEPMASLRAGQPLTLHARVANPLTTPLDARVTVRVDGKSVGEAAVKLRPGEETSVAVPVHYALRDHDGVAAEMEWTTGQADVLAKSPVWLNVLDPLPLTVLPAAGRQVTVLVANPGGAAFTGTLRATAGGQKAEGRVALKAGEESATVTLALPADVAPGQQVVVDGSDAAGAQVWRPAASAWRPAFALAPGAAWRARLDGDAKVVSEAEVSVVPAPAGLPQAGLTHALEVRYRFGDGWRFACIAPPQGAAAIEGKPVRLGMWVFGDGEGHSLRCRFVDSTGQTFQPNLGPITWKGWRFVTMPMDGRDSGRWGGADDGIVHYPIHWDCPILVDSNKTAINRESRVWVTGIALE